MAQWDAIWDRARSDLTLPTEHGDQDVLLWEHSARVARSARRIAQLPSLSALSPDELAVAAAALYHDAAWAARASEEPEGRYAVLARAPAGDHRAQSAALMERSLEALVPSDSLDRASRAIRFLDQRDTDYIEAQIVADADHLEEFGVGSLWMTIRRGLLDGSGIQAVIDRWHRRNEYHYWPARLNDSFRLQVVRTAARKRLDMLKRLMQDLEAEQNGTDFGERANEEG